MSQSLPFFQAPAYRERAEKLIEEIKHLLSSYMEDSCNDDLIKRASDRRHGSMSRN
jgi:hypothetical protein